MKLSTAEQAAYGSAFAAEYRRLTMEPPAHVTHANSTWEAWERMQATSAAEVAWAVVDKLRSLRLDLVAGFGEESDVVEMYDACCNSSS